VADEDTTRHVHSRRVAGIGLFLTLLFVPFTASAQDREAKILGLITDTAERLCGTVPTQGVPAASN
jgi:hypothetical protein